MRVLAIQEVQAMQLTLMKKLHNFLADKEISYYLIAGSALGAVRHQGFIPWDDDIDIGMFRANYEKFLKVCCDFDKEYQIVNYHNGDNCDFCLTRIYFDNTYIDNTCIRDTKLDKRLYLDIFPLDNVPDNQEERDEFESKINQLKKWIALIDARKYDNNKKNYFIKKIISAILSPFRKKILKKCDNMMRTYLNTPTDMVCSICSQYSFQKQAMPKEYYGKPTLHTFQDTEFYLPEQIDNYLVHLYGMDYMKIPPVSKRRKGYDIYLVEERGICQ